MNPLSSNWHEVVEWFYQLDFSEKLEWWDNYVSNENTYIELEYYNPNCRNYPHQEGSIFFFTEYQSRGILSIVPDAIEFSTLWNWIKIDLFFEHGIRMDHEVDYYNIEQHYTKIINKLLDPIRPVYIRQKMDEISSSLLNQKDSSEYFMGVKYAVDANYMDIFGGCYHEAWDTPNYRLSLFFKGYIDKLSQIFFDNYHINLNHSETKNLGITSNIKLQWNGNTKVLYDLFAQCLTTYKEGKPYLENTIEDLAEFIIQNFEGIKANKKTIATEIGKLKTGNSKPPKEPTRIKIQ